MAGNTNLAYRRLCRRFGAELTTTEMVSAKALIHGDQKTHSLLARDEEERPIAAQVFGAEAQLLADAVRRIADLGFDAVDLNIGCPVPKITGGGGGSALLREPTLAARCVSAMAAASHLPITVKIRTGWDEENRNAPEFARCMEAAGAQLLTVHGRTREQGYRGEADYDLIGEVVAQVSIPVIGNGDVVDLEHARELAATGVAGIAVGRGALGRPWFFAELRAWAEGAPPPPTPELPERAALLLELGTEICALHGERRGIRIMRRMASDFFHGLPGSAKLRSHCHSLETLRDLRELASRGFARETTRLLPLGSVRVAAS